MDLIFPILSFDTPQTKDDLKASAYKSPPDTKVQIPPIDPYPILLFPAKKLARLAIDLIKDLGNIAGIKVLSEAAITYMEDVEGCIGTYNLTLSLRLSRPVVEEFAREFAAYGVFLLADISKEEGIEIQPALLEICQSVLKGFVEI